MSTASADDAKPVSEGDIGFVDQKYTLFRHETIHQICRYALRKSKSSKVDKEALIDKYLHEWGLEEHKNKYSCELSGGQRQRTAIIEQMLSSKHFMILDEPFSGLDVGNIDKVKQSFERISNDNEFNTTIFSTHDIKLAVEMADSIYIVGFPEGVTDYSTIIKHYDLKSMGLAWTEYGEGHRQLCSDIRELLLRS
jgi:polar amino acid transport system ATP-binding protein